ncbi:hypothetical protein KDB89_02440 [Tessaracoccus palaemonis]|uniref:Uncharacterized protein n=1 Tax=Tessaracoccus palaemonis TaxID=2829499 RepID=A0ABX8SMI0_9ACTN|nr:hypothetical protein KDB89_02440 [Tessaracoccus palaemonis]
MGRRPAAEDRELPTRQQARPGEAIPRGRWGDRVDALQDPVRAFVADQPTQESLGAAAGEQLRRGGDAALEPDQGRQSDCIVVSVGRPTERTIDLGLDAPEGGP